MTTCKTCKHWKIPSDEYYNEIVTPHDSDTFEPMEMPFQVRFCTSPKITFYERPVESNGATVCDGSNYDADLITAEDFGCVLWEPIEGDASITFVCPDCQRVTVDPADVAALEEDNARLREYIERLESKLYDIVGSKRDFDELLITIKEER